MKHNKGAGTRRRSQTDPERRREAVASLRSYMAARKLTAEDTATLLGVSKPSVSGWLRGAGMSRRCLELVEKLALDGQGAVPAERAVRRCLNMVEMLMTKEQAYEPLECVIRRGMADALKTALVSDMMASKMSSECLVQVVMFLRSYDLDAVLRRLVQELELRRRETVEGEEEETGKQVEED